MRYRVKALGRSGEVEQVELEALDELVLARELDNRGLSAISVRAMDWRLPGATRAPFPLLIFSQQLLVLLQSGLALVPAFEALVDSEPRPGIRHIMTQVLQALHEGKALSVALAGAPAAFPELYVALIQASEKTSDLDQALARFVRYQEQLDAVKGRLTSALIYPVVLLAVALLVVVFLLGYVVPRFSHIYEDIGGDLPWMSRVLIQWGNLVDSHGWMILAATVGIAVGVVSLVRSMAWQAWFGRQIWRAPLLGERLRVFQLARFYRSLGMLLRGGIPVIQGLKMVRAMLSPTLQRRLEQAIDQVRCGNGLAASMEAAQMATPVALRMLRVGEQTGNMGEMMERIAVFHDDETARFADWLTKLFGPVLMLFVGATIGGIVVLMYLPIFQLAENIR